MHAEQQYREQGQTLEQHTASYLLGSRVDIGKASLTCRQRPQAQPFRLPAQDQNENCYSPHHTAQQGTR